MWLFGESTADKIRRLDDEIEELEPGSAARKALVEERKYYYDHKNDTRQLWTQIGLGIAGGAIALYQVLVSARLEEKCYEKESDEYIGQKETVKLTAKARNSGVDTFNSVSRWSRKK